MAELKMRFSDSFLKKEVRCGNEKGMGGGIRPAE